MKKLCKIMVLAWAVMTLTACVGEEPNDIAYITAVGIDKEEEGFRYTIQFANPTKISGGASEEGGSGGNIVENIVVYAPTLYSGLNSADAIVSKDFSLAHAKLIVVSEEVAREGLGGLSEVISRNNDIRPDAFLAVAEDSEKYLESVKPVIELNPVKYYQLTYENKKGGSVPQNDAAEFIMALMSRDRDCALPLAGIAGIKEESQGTDAGSSGGDSKSEPEENKKAEKARTNEENFQNRTKNYFAGEAGIKIKNKSEALGMAIFKGDTYIGKLGGTDAIVHNILLGKARDMEIVFTLKDEPLPITVRLSGKRIPKVTLQKDTTKAKVDIILEGELISLPEASGGTEGVIGREEECAKYVEDACEDFINRLYHNMGVDILGICGKMKQKFLTNHGYNTFKDDFNPSQWNIDVAVTLTIKRSGMSY